MAKWVQGTNEQGQPDWAWETDDGQYLDRDPDGNMSPEIDTSAELGVVDRLRYALAPDNPEAQLEAIKRLGKQGVIENGKVYVVEGGRRYEPDSPDLTWKDAADVVALVPEAIGSTFGGIGGGLIGAATTGGAGAVPGSMAGAGIGGGAGTYVRHKAAQLAGVVDPDAPVPIGDIAESAAINTALPAIGQIPGVKQAGKSIISGIGKVAAYPLEKAAMLKEGSLARMASKEGEAAYPMTKDIQGAMRKVSKDLGETITKAKNKLHLEYKQGLKALGLDQAPVDIQPRMQPVFDLVEGEYRVLSKGAKGKIGDESDLGVIRSYILEAIEPKTMADAEDLISRIDADIAWPSPMQSPKVVSDKAQSALRSIRDAVRESMTDTATAAGKGTEFEGLKQEATKNIEMFENLRGFLGGKADKSLRNIESEANWSASEALGLLAEKVPNAKPMIDKAKATTLAYDFAGGGAKRTLGADRLVSGGFIAGGVADPLTALAAYGATRPQVLAPVAYGAGKATRAMAPLAEPLAPIGRAVARQATVETIRRNTGLKSAQASELREIGKLAPATDAPASLVRDVIESQKAPALEYVNTHYRQLLDKYRALGMADDDAAMAVVRDIGGRKKNGGRVAPFIDNIKRELRTAGYDVKEPDVIQFMNTIQE